MMNRHDELKEERMSESSHMNSVFKQSTVRTLFIVCNGAGERPKLVA
jgi:hypothetical protein